MYGIHPKLKHGPAKETQEQGERAVLSVTGTGREDVPKKAKADNHLFHRRGTHGGHDHVGHHVFHRPHVVNYFDRSTFVVKLRASSMKLLRLIPILILMTGGVVPLRAEVVDGVVAIINDKVITRQQVQDFAAPAIDSLRRTYADNQMAYETQLNSALTNSLELLIERDLILHDFDVEGYHLPDSVVDQLVDERIRERFGDRVSLTKTLVAQGETYAQFREDVRDQYIESALRAKNVSQEVIISPFQMENYYVSHQNDFKVEDQIKLRMIVLKKSSSDDTNTAALAREIISEIKNGATFAQMASVYSQGSQKKDAGEWGWIERSSLRPELAQAALPLQAGQISDVIDTPDTCYVMLVEDKRVAHVKTLNEVRDSIESTLRAQEEARLERQWIDSLKKKTFIRIFP
jgi:parvulin-like peptidyl-prolyl isomerase